MRGRKKVASDCTTYPNMRGAVYVTRTDIYVLVHVVQIAMLITELLLQELKVYVRC